MKLSTKGRYGLKAMVDLGLQYGLGPVTVGALALEQGISVAYLERIIGSLKKSGLVTSSRGAQGGYTLSRPPELINVADVLRALEGTTSLVDCVDSRGMGCDNACSCSARPLWIKLQAGINDVLNSTSIKDMMDDYLTQKRRIGYEQH